MEHLPIIATVSAASFLLWKTHNYTPPKIKPTPLTPAKKHHVRHCNPFTADTVLSKNGYECLCKYPNLVVNNGSDGDCTKVIACEHGKLIHKDTKTPFNGDWDPQIYGECLCDKGFKKGTLEKCIPDSCKNGTFNPDTHQCDCNEGYVQHNSTCIFDPCEPHGIFKNGKCVCNEGFVPKFDNGLWTCIDPCDEDHNPCGNRGVCQLDGTCSDCIYPFYQTPDNLCKGEPKEAGEICSDDAQCISQKCYCHNQHNDRACCLV